MTESVCCLYASAAFMCIFHNFLFVNIVDAASNTVRLIVRAILFVNGIACK